MQKLALNQTPEATQKLRKHMNAVVGQDHVLDALCNTHERYTAKLYNPEKPLDTYLFLGPTGTGKTYTAQVFATWLHGENYKPLIIDCGEYAHGHEIAKLLGSPPGYLGHRETPPLLTVENIYSQGPPAVIVFDEVEKAHGTLWNLLLGVLDTGNITLGDNRKSSLKDCFIFFTSNVGVKDLAAARNTIGFGKNTTNPNDTVIQAAKKTFSPEFLNRINHKMVFDTLSKDVVQDIIRMELKKIKDRMMRTHRTFIRFDDSVIERIYTEAYSSEYNAREIVRYLEKNILFTLARAVNSCPPNEGFYRTFKVTVEDTDFAVYTTDFASLEEAVTDLQATATGAPA